MSSLMSLDSMSDLTDNFGFATHFNYLRKKKLHIDVTFIIETEDGEVEDFAHQLILAMRSSYFGDVFYCDQRQRKIKEKQIIRLGKINLKAFKDMIGYCYGCQPDLERTQEICTLFKLAHQFKVMSLMNLCRTHLRDIQIELRNVFDMLEVSECMDDSKLRDMCCKLLKDKTRDVFASYEKEEITSTVIHIIISLPTLSLYSEYELMKWVFEWAKVKSEEGSVRQRTREYLDGILKSLNFLALTFKEFALLCKDYPDVFTSEEIASVYLNIAFPRTRDMPHWYDKGVKIREFTGSKP